MLPTSFGRLFLAVFISLPATALVAKPKAGENVTANHCEIFIDRIAPVEAGHGVRQLYVYIKTINGRLDGEVKEVGFRYQRTRPDTGGTEIWKNKTVAAFGEAKDYWEIPLGISADYVGRQSYEGKFYVRSASGKTYWLKTPAGRNTTFDLALFDRVSENVGSGNFKPGPDRALATTDKAIDHLNPDKCE